MVRTDQPLVERMTLIWHDWFATSNDGVGQQRLMLDQNELFRRHAFGSFDQLAHDVTQDPAMIVWLNLNENTRWSPNENYARELMELFTLGADRGAYTEQDVRELARALTGFDFDWSDELGLHNFRYVPTRHDAGSKTIFGQTGAWTWEQGVGDVRAPPDAPLLLRPEAVELLHPHSAVGRRTGRRSNRCTCRAATWCGRCSRRSSCTPHLHTGSRMVKPPVVLLAGLLRALQRSRRRRVLDLATPMALASGSSTRPTCPAGTTRAGSTRARCAAAASWSRARSRTVSSRATRWTTTTRPRRPSRRLPRLAPGRTTRA